MAVTKLDLSDLRCIRQELHSVKEKWLDIGMELNQVSPAELRKIAENHKQDYSICLNLMLMQWLERGDASWEILCKALQSTIVNEPALCKQLQAKYCSSNTQFEYVKEQTSKSLKRGHPNEATTPKAKRPRTTVLPTSFAPEDFLRTQPPDRICYKCNKIPCTPLRPQCCNTKLYCEPCATKVKICSTHQHEITYKRDDVLFTLVPKLKIKCPNWKQGCAFKDTASKVHREHLPLCTKSKHGAKEKTSHVHGSVNVATSKYKTKTKDIEEVVNELWYLASNESHPLKTKCASTKPAVLSPKNEVPHKDTSSLTLPLKSTTDELKTLLQPQPKPKSAPGVKGPSQPNQMLPGVYFAAYQQPQQFMICESFQAGELAKHNQHVSMHQSAGNLYPAGNHLQMKVNSGTATDVKSLQTLPASPPVQPRKIDVKQEPSSPKLLNIKKEPMSPRAMTFGSSTVKDVQNIKKEPLSRMTGSNAVKQLWPCEYQAIGCKKMVPQGKMKLHHQESMQHHLDLAIKQILLLQATKK